MDELKEKLRKLKEQRKQASHSNFKEVLEENERSKRPANWEKKHERDLKKVRAEEEKRMIEESGQDYEIKKSLNYQADEVERWHRSKANKKKKEPGIVIKDTPVTKGDEELPHDSKEGVARMVEDTRKRIELRSKRSRRRRFDDDADVDYINERNMKFNKKLERYYGQHTQEIKQNFERGTAL